MQVESNNEIQTVHGRISEGYNMSNNVTAYQVPENAAMPCQRQTSFTPLPWIDADLTPRTSDWSQPVFRMRLTLKRVHLRQVCDRPHEIAARQSKHASRPSQATVVKTL